MHLCGHELLMLALAVPAVRWVVASGVALVRRGR